MKKFLYVLPLALLFSCMGMLTVVAELGMTEEEFKKKNMGYDLVELWGDVKVFRVQHHPTDFPKYVYFENGKLVRMDEGQMRYGGILYPDFEWEAPIDPEL
ncbi:MAG TPA: hypothetical protein VK921_14715 [Anditalea sp.]|nr:hypothetical protein [Anditalea sp.]